MSFEPEFLTLNLPFPGFKKLCLGKDTKVLGVNFKQHTFYIKLMGAEPEKIGEKVKIFTLGFFMIKKENRVRAGLVKRHQVLMKA